MFNNGMKGFLSHHWIFLIFIPLCLLMWVGFIQAPPVMQVGQGEKLRLVRDQAELTDVYFDRSSIVPRGEIPYAETRQEYPLLGIAYLSFPRLFTNNPFIYEQILTFGNVLLLICTMWLTLQLMKKLGQNMWYALLFFLPATLYFSLNRFDIAIVALVQVSLLLLLNRRWNAALALLAVGFFIKWYTVLFIPIFIIYWLTQESGLEKKRIHNSLWLVGSVIGIPTLALLFISGQGSLFPYAFHAQRGIEYGNVLIPYLGQILNVLPESAHAVFLRVVSLLLFVGQVTLPIIMLLSFSQFKKYIITFRDVVKWMAIVLTLFFLFAKFYSPQYILWLLPLLILLIRPPKDLILYIALDVVHYLSFPVIYDQFAWDSVPYAMMALVRTLLYGVLLIRLAKSYLFQERTTPV